MRDPKFQQEVLEPISQKLLAKQKKLMIYVEKLEGHPLDKATKKLVIEFFTTLSGEVAKEQLILLKNFFFQKNQDLLSEKVSTNWLITEGKKPLRKQIH